jgi:hypothetical protein
MELHGHRKTNSQCKPDRLFTGTCREKDGLLLEISSTLEAEGKNKQLNKSLGEGRGSKIFDFILILYGKPYICNL